MTFRFGWSLVPICCALVACTPVNSNNNHADLSYYVGVETAGYDASFETLSDALVAAKQARADNAAVEIILSDGVHYLDQALIIGSDLSGTKDKPFRIKAKTEREAVLSGAKAVALDWSKFSDEVYVAKIDDAAFDSLFVNQTKQIRARYPNYDAGILPFGGYDADAISPDRVKTWANPRTGVFHALHDGRWGGWHYSVEGVNVDGIVKLGSGVGNNRPSEPHTDYRYIENIFEELDSPGEWFFDSDAGQVFYYPPESVDMSTAKFSVSTTENLIELRGTVKNPVQHVEIEGLVFTGTKMTFSQTTEPLLRSDWMVHRGGAVLFEGTEHSFIRNSEFEGLGGNAVFFSGYNRHSGAMGNKISNIGASGISAVGKPSAVRSPSFTYAEFVDLEDMDFEYGPKSPDYPAHILIEDNLITDIGTIEKQVAGVQIAMASDVNVFNNSIYDVPRSGINIGDGTWGGHVIRGNDVFNTVLETGDHGAFNSWGRDRFWHPNRDVMNEIAKTYPELIFADAVAPVIIEGNRWQSDHGWDIDLDDGSSNYVIRNNLCLTGGLKLREGFKRTVVNNILINNTFHPHVWFENSQDVFQRNIVMSYYKPIWVDHWGTQIDSNFFPSQIALEKAQSLGNDKASLSGDPDFIDPDKNNFHVSSNSLALKVGFENFPMEFGVKSSWLQEQARKPKVSELFSNHISEENNPVVELLGATLRSVTTEGEKSAFGLPDTSGVIVEDVSPNSIADQGKLRAGDVIVGVVDSWNKTDEKIQNVNALRANHQAWSWQSKYELIIVRNQVEQRLMLTLK